jgi:hypothetical protein
MTRTILTILSLLFAFAAAGLWWRSAVIKTPGHFHITVISGGAAMGSPTLFGSGHSHELQALGAALSRQSRRSAWAAICAGVSTLCQAVATAID